jgi:hypothetical protein
MAYRISWTHEDGSQDEGPAVFANKANAIRVARKDAKSAWRKEAGYVAVWVDDSRTDCGIWHRNI